MATRLWRDADIDLTPLQGKNVGVLGYGNQGRPQALNLRDSGITLKVGLRPESPLHALTRQEGITSESIDAVCRWADVLMLLLPDESLASVYEQHIQPNFRPGGYIGLGHGMAIDAGWLRPDAKTNVFLVAPKAQGRGVRQKFVDGSGVPAMVCAHQDPSGDTLPIALAYAKAIGCGRAAVIETTMREETVCDLFSEQAVLCGGLSNLIRSAFDTLVEAGFSPEAAYIECLYEVKLIGDLLHDKGISGMREAISSTARFGDLSRGHKIIDGHVRENMRQVLDDITSGRFYNDISTMSGGALADIQERDRHHPIERTFHQLKPLLFRSHP
jgi:ketol-acid reductoisomerase